MSNLNHRLFKLFLLLSIAAAFSCSALKAQESESRNLAWAQEFLQRLYPEITYHKYVMTATTYHPFDVPVQSMGNLNIQIGEMSPGAILGIAVPAGIVGREPPKDRKYGPIYAKQFINASFGFDMAGRLFSFASEGPAVGKQEDYDHLKQIVGYHPEWTDAQVVSALRKAGASYGPEEKDKFLEVIPIAQLEKLLGKITIASSEFETATDNEQRFPLIQWVVLLNVTFGNGQTRTYRTIFEPFKGELTRMDAVSP